MKKLSIIIAIILIEFGCNQIPNKSVNLKYGTSHSDLNSNKKTIFDSDGSLDNVSYVADTRIITWTMPLDLLIE